MVTIEAVELLDVREAWEAGTGDVDFIAADLVAAVEAQNDPAVRKPVLKFGHIDPRFDGEPAVGTVENLRLSDNGLTLLGDFVGVPQWLAACMASAYPRRSIEGRFNWQTKTDHVREFALTAVALLGTAYPAVTTLEDIQHLYDAETIEDVDMVPAEDLVAASSKDEDVKTLRKREKSDEVQASMLIEEVRMEYIDTLEGDAYWDYWIRQVQLDPNALIVEDCSNGGLLSVGFTISGEHRHFRRSR